MANSLIGLRRCAVWFAPLLFACNNFRFPRITTHILIQSTKLMTKIHMRGSRKFFSEGVPLFYVCISWLGERGSEYHYKRVIIGQQEKRNLYGISLAGRWWLNTECWLESFVRLQGIRTNIAKKPYIFVIFKGGPDPCPPSGSAHDTVGNDSV